MRYPMSAEPTPLPSRGFASKQRQSAFSLILNLLCGATSLTMVLSIAWNDPSDTLGCGGALLMWVAAPIAIVGGVRSSVAAILTWDTERTKGLLNAAAIVLCMASLVWITCKGFRWIE